MILSSIECEQETTAKNRCGSCTKSIEACPTQAITAPYQLDARRCISYLTIENKGAIPLEFRRSIGDRIYGCDDCLDACPWHRFAQITSETRSRIPEPPTHLGLRVPPALSNEQ